MNAKYAKAASSAVFYVRNSDDEYPNNDHIEDMCNTFDSKSSNKTTHTRQKK